MKVSDVMSLIDARNLTPDVALDRDVTCGYVCDLLSWVMAHGEEGMAWVTVQTHLNVVAVAALAEMACVILPEGIVMEQESLDFHHMVAEGYRQILQDRSDVVRIDAAASVEEIQQQIRDCIEKSLGEG